MRFAFDNKFLIDLIENLWLTGAKNLSLRSGIIFNGVIPQWKGNFSANTFLPSFFNIREGNEKEYQQIIEIR